MSSGLDVRIRELVDNGAPPLTLAEVDALRAFIAPRRRSKGPLVAVAIVATVIVLVVVLALATGDDGSQSVRVPPAQSVSTSPPPTRQPSGTPAERTAHAADYVYAVDNRHLVVGAGCPDDTPAADVTETRTAVRIRVVYTDSHAFCLTGSVRITLDSPLGTRRIIDATTGRAIPKGQEACADMRASTKAHRSQIRGRMFLSAAESVPMQGLVTATAVSPSTFRCSVQTDEDGQFTMYVPTPGRYVITGLSPHYFEGHSECVGTTSGGLAPSTPVSISRTNNVVHIDVLCNGV
jgi:hypothetical protein